MPNKTPIFFYDNCIACGICAIACPVSSLEMNRIDIDEFKNAYPSLTDRQCIGCAQCEKNCPMDAIAMQESA
jgi:hydrogenase-4 component H